MPVLAAALAALLATPSPLPYAPDEQAEYAVHFLGLKVGAARLWVGTREGALLPVFLQARTGGVVSMVDVREMLSSNLDTETGLPRSSRLDAVEPGYRHSDTTRFDRRAGTATVTSRGRSETTEVVEVPPGTLDFVALVFRLRTLPLPEGARHEFPVLAGSKVRTIAAVVAGRERVETGAGAFEAVKVRIPTGFTGKFSEKDPTYVWFSDDARRIVVRIATDFAIGNAIATLSAYRPGRNAAGAAGAAPP